MSDVTLSTPPTPPKYPQMTITNFNYEGSYLPGLICNIVVKADLGRSPGRSTSPLQKCQLVVMYGKFTFLATMKVHIGRSTGRSTPPVKLPSSCQEWQFLMSCYYLSSYWEINWQIYPPENCHLVVKNGNFTCLSTMRVHIGRSTSRYILYLM